MVRESSICTSSSICPSQPLQSASASPAAVAMKLLLVLTSLLAVSQAQSLAQQFCDTSNTQSVELDRFAEPSTCESMPVWQSPECLESTIEDFCSDDADVDSCRKGCSKIRCCNQLTRCETLVSILHSLSLSLPRSLALSLTHSLPTSPSFLSSLTLKPVHLG
jgi:hypothetical protein